MTVASSSWEPMAYNILLIERYWRGKFFMLRNGFLLYLPGGAALRRRPRLRRGLVIILQALVCCVIAIAAPKAGGNPGQAKDVAASEFVGSDTCAGCHEEVSRGFASNPHIKM